MKPLSGDQWIALEAYNFRVYEEGTGKDGLISVSMNHPELYFSTVGLPDQDESQVLKQLRVWAKIPVLSLPFRTMKLPR